MNWIKSKENFWKINEYSSLYDLYAHPHHFHPNRSKTYKTQDVKYYSIKLRKKNHIKTIAGTLASEGNHTREEKITTILEGKRVLATPKDLAEVYGAIKAYQKISNYRFDQLEDLLQAHKPMMEGIITGARKMREINVAVGSHIAPPPNLVAKLMNELCMTGS